MRINTLNPYKSNNLSSIEFIEHAFFTKNGGVSSGDFFSLNTSLYTKDNENNVKKNRSIILDYFKKNDSKLITLKQQSQDNIITITDKKNIPNSTTEGDALITNVPGIILGIHTADCVPILMADPKTHTVAAIHAGHKGAYLGIVKKTINLLISMGVNPNNLVVALGPSIKQESYEVKSDFYKLFLKQNQENKQFFLYNNIKNSYFFSLQQYIIKELINLQVNNIEELPYNTYTYPGIFFSHRYSTKTNTDRGLQISTILIKE